MKNSFLLALLFIIWSCSNDSSTDALLTQPPFNKLTDSIQHDKKNAELYYRRGVLLFQNSQPAYAETDLRQAWKLLPTEQHALSMVTLLIDKNSDSALQFINEAQKELPNSIALQISAARGYQQKSENEKALELCNQVLAKYQNQIDALVLKAELLKSLDKDEEALSTLEKAYQFAPFDPELSQNLAFAYAEAKNPKALLLADSLIKADSLGRHAEPYYFKGYYYENIGNSAEALRLFDAAIQHDYNFLDAHMEKGTVLYNLKKYGDALKVFNLAATITPTYAEAYYWMGKCQQALHQNEEARLNYQRAYGLDKTLTEAKEAADKLQ